MRGRGRIREGRGEWQREYKIPIYGVFTYNNSLHYSTALYCATLWLTSNATAGSGVPPLEAPTC